MHGRPGCGAVCIPRTQTGKLKVRGKGKTCLQPRNNRWSQESQATRRCPLTEVDGRVIPVAVGRGSGSTLGAGPIGAQCSQVGEQGGWQLRWTTLTAASPQVNLLMVGTGDGWLMGREPPRSPCTPTLPGSAAWGAPWPRPWRPGLSVRPEGMVASLSTQGLMMGSGQEDPGI